MILQSIIQSSQYKQLDIFPYIETLTPGIDITPVTCTYFNAYKTSDFPSIAIDKTYFFLYSTDHATGDGGCYIGKGNNLDLSDFVEVGLIIDGFQAETPFPMYIEGDVRPFYLYYHTSPSDPDNAGIQETKLITTADTDWTTATWIYEGHPLGSEIGDSHTGYFRGYKIGVNNFKATHYKTGATIGGYFDPSWQLSTATTDLKNWTRANIIDIDFASPAGRFAVVSYGLYFLAHGQWWWIGETEQHQGATTLSETKGLALCRSNSNFEILEYLATLNNGTLELMGWNAHQENGIIHLYGSSNVSIIRYSYLDENQLLQFM